MSETQESDVGDDETEVISTRSHDSLAEVSSTVTLDHKDSAENGNSHSSRQVEDKGQELPELIRDKEGRREMMPGLPSINLSELTVILRDPNMPSHKIMKEVAEKMMLKSEESESDDGSVGSTGGVVGMKGLLDCIFEVTFQHTDAGNSDTDDDDETFERIPREIPCSFCNKVFGSTMTWKTHVLVAHQDPSVLNIRQLSTSEADRKEKNHPAHRKHSRSTPKTDTDLKNTKARHAPKTNTSEMAEAPHVRSDTRHTPASRSHQNEMSGEVPSSIHQVERKPLPTEIGENVGAASNYSGVLTQDVIAISYQHKTIESADHNAISDSLKVPETNLRDTGSTESGESLLTPAKDAAESQELDHITQADHASQTRRNMKEKRIEDTNIPTESPICETEGGRKRRATSPFQESTSPLSDAKRSRKNVPD